MGRIPLSVDSFVRAGSDRMLADIRASAGGIDRWRHDREPADVGDQVVVRMNRDTLYSTAVVDLAEGATLTVGEAGERYLSESQDHDPESAPPPSTSGVAGTTGPTASPSWRGGTKRSGPTVTGPERRSSTGRGVSPPSRRSTDPDWRRASGGPPEGAGARSQVLGGCSTRPAPSPRSVGSATATCRSCCGIRRTARRRDRFHGVHV
jgi:hypothetical protein